MKRALATAIATVAVIGSATGSAEAKSTGQCPRSGGYELVTVESLGIDPVIATGVASLDGNVDGQTCIRQLPNGDGFIFRDNTVQPLDNN